jgi:hypothetical protein
MSIGSLQLHRRRFHDTDADELKKNTISDDKSLIEFWPTDLARAVVETLWQAHDTSP